MLQHSYRYPAPRETVDFVSDGIKRIRAGLTPAQDERIAGLGIAMPFELWNWADTAGAPREVMEHWRNRDIRADIQAQCDFPVYLQNDATVGLRRRAGVRQTAARRATSSISTSAPSPAAASCSTAGSTAGRPAMPARSARCRFRARTARRAQLIDVASIAMLEKALNANGRRRLASVDLAGGLGRASAPELDALDRLGRRRRSPTRSSPPPSVIDFEAAVIDGWMPASVRARLVAAIGDALQTIDVEGLTVPPVREGTVGIHARALGGASLPLSDRFLVGATAVVRQDRLSSMLIGIPAILGPDCWRPCAPWAMATRSPSSTATIRRSSMRGGWCAPTATA